MTDLAQTKGGSNLQPVLSLQKRRNDHKKEAIIKTDLVPIITTESMTETVTRRRRGEIGNRNVAKGNERESERRGKKKIELKKGPLNENENLNSVWERYVIKIMDRLRAYNQEK